MFCLCIYSYFSFFISSISIAAEHEKVSIQLKWFHGFQFAGYYAAIEQGFYAEEGLEVTLKERNTQKMRIPDDPDHPFHLIPATDSISSRPVIPGHSGH